MNRSKKLVKTMPVIVSVVAVFAAAIFAGCIQDNGNTNDIKEYYEYSFEEGLNDWNPDGTDLDDPPINWSVEKTDNISYSGNSSVKLYLENFNDAGKIWMEKIFNVKKNTIYEVSVEYKFGTTDWGEFNLFNIITTISADMVTKRDDLVYREDTGHHTDTEDLVWLDKSYDSIVETDSDGIIYINIGVWGNWETTRTYYVDDVNISIIELDPIDEYPDLSGNWTLKNYDFMGNLTSEKNVTINQEDGEVTIEFEMGIPCTGTIVKNTMDNSFVDTDFIIKGCDFGGLGIDTIYIINETSMKTEMPTCETCNPSIFTH